MSALFALTAVLTIIQGDVTVSVDTTSGQCGPLLREMSERIPDADLICTVYSPRPVARPADLMHVEGVE